jgi:hypothetical protein
MLNGKIPELDPKFQKEILGIIDSRKSMYGAVRVTAALKKENDAWKSVLTRFEILAKDDEKDSERIYDYRNFQIRQARLTLDQFRSILSKLIEGAKLSLPNFAEIPIEGFLQNDLFYAFPQSYHSSNDTILGLNWPANVFLFDVDNKFKGALPSEPLVALNQPLFESGYAVFRVLFGFDVQQSQYLGKILFILPNFAVKITQVKLGSNQMSISILTKGVSAEETVAKIYCEAPPKVYQTEVLFKDSRAEIPLDFAPYYYLIYLLSKKTGEILDHRRFHLSWANLPDDIVREASPEDVEQIIMLGEGSEVEFKQEFPTNWDEFGETIVAFSNTRGGTIFVGVDDHGSITGIKNSKTEDAIQDSVRSHVEPPVEIRMTKHEVSGQSILAVQVKEGENKPYMLRNKGAFVRAGKTDRIATRIELDEMYARRNQSSLGHYHM